MNSLPSDIKPIKKQQQFLPNATIYHQNNIKFKPSLCIAYSKSKTYKMLWPTCCEKSVLGLLTPFPISFNGSKQFPENPTKNDFPIISFGSIPFFPLLGCKDIH